MILASYEAAEAQLDLTMEQSSQDPALVTMRWTGGPGPYQAFRSTGPIMLGVPANLLGLTGAMEWDDPDSLPAPGALYYYDVRIRRCGDFITDLDEECDDGNQSDGDGCSADCSRQWNVLLMIADDMGVETMQTYIDILPSLGIVIPPPSVPSLEMMVDNGVTFWKAYSNPSCTPTRAGLYSGFHAFEHALTSPTVLISGCPTAPSLEERLTTHLGGAPALPGVLPSVYRKALFGKWHLGGEPGAAPSPCDDDFYDTMLALGWDYQDGSFEDIKDDTTNNEDYCDWPEHVIDGALDSVNEETYATDYVMHGDTADSTQNGALGWIDDEQDAPWWVTIAFNTPHTPIHDPDPLNCSESACASTPLVCYQAMIEYMDTVIGEAITELESLGELEDTILIFIGDNGTQEDPVYSVFPGPYPTGQYKGTVYDGGVNVPLIIADGCHLSGSTTCTPLIDNPGRYKGALVHTLDLFATIRSITGGTDDTSTYGRRSVDMKPYLTTPGFPNIRDFLYTQSGTTCAIRDGRFKLILNACTDGTSGCEYYDLLSDPTETTDLLTGALTPLQANALADLKTEVASVRTWTNEPMCP